MGADFLQALRLIVSGDAEVWQVLLVSLQVSLVALLLASLVGLPLAYALSQARRPLARLATLAVHTATALPTVVIGLTLYFMLSASGPFGWMQLLYTRAAMTLGQFVLALPIVTAVALVALSRIPADFGETVTTLGLPRLRAMRLFFAESKPALASGVLLAFARVFTELGAAIILGGNIRGETRTLTTVIALEYDRGDAARAIALGVILVIVALGVNAVAHRLTPARG
jgi:tungstate transport system permease protein